MLAVTPLRQLAGFLPVIAVVVVIGVGQDIGGRAYGLSVGVLVVLLAGVLRWLTTRYRITSERVELRSGLLFRTARSIPRDRIRSVDVTAGLVHRLFRLSVVKIGTGERTDGVESRELTLDAISATEADRVRQRLLDPLDVGHVEGSGVAVPPAVTELAALNWSWLRFAPLTVSSLVAVGAVAGAFGQLINDVGADAVDVGGVRERAEHGPAVAGRHRVRRAGAGDCAGGLGVDLRRGLVEVSAGLANRAAPCGSAADCSPPGRCRWRSVDCAGSRWSSRRCCGSGAGHGPSLWRPAWEVAVVTAGAACCRRRRADEAHRVSGAVLAEDPSPTRTALRSHPLVALRRRLVRATVPVLAGSAVLWFAPVPLWLAWAALGLLPVTVLLAVDAYRNLGHALTSRYLVTRHGAGMRGTVALQRCGVIGWTVSQSFFQRRAGLVTVTATTAAGNGGYRVIDVVTAEGLAVAEQAVPGLLEPFLQHDVGGAARTLGSDGVNDRLVWIDCEMTGLDVGKDALIEIAALVTDGELECSARASTW